MHYRLTMCCALALVACSSSQSAAGASNDPTPAPEPRQDEASEAPVVEEETTPVAEPSGPAADFERFLLTGSESPCPAQANGDCDSFAELLADGTLRMDPWGAPTTSTLTARVPEPALTAAIAVLTAAPLISELEQSLPCSTANRSETMLVRVAGRNHDNQTGFCNSPSIQAVRGVLMALTSEHFPQHSLISPPF